MLISVVIPTSNRPQLLAQLVKALRRQRFDHPFEIIIVDDCEKNDLNYLRFRTKRCQCVVVSGEGKGPARARNLGASQATGTYLPRGVPVSMLTALSQLVICAGYVRERMSTRANDIPAVVAPAREPTA